MTRAAVFLDRDGVLNEVVQRDGAPVSPRRLDDFRIVPDAADAVRRLRAAGLAVFVVTNQPDIARGLLPPHVLAGMTARLRSELSVDDVRICPHDDADDCDCRKPRPGLLEQLAGEWQIELDRSCIIGDTWRDMDAGRAAGCRTVLLRTWYNADASGDVEVETLTEAADWIVESMATSTGAAGRAGSRP